MTGKVFGVHFAPLNIPWRRRLQMFFVIVYIFILWSPMVALFLCVLATYHGFWWLPTAYLAYMLYDRETPKKGGRPVAMVRNWRCWDHFREYFPMTVEKTVDLDPDRNYILGFHPHGILVTGMAGNLMANGGRLRKLFPGLTWRGCTLRIFFWLPIARDLIMSLGAISVSRESIEHVLRREGRGNALVVVVGGAQEAFNALPGNAVLRLRDRIGFVKIAMQNGADLVPIYSFGENDLFTLVDAPAESNWRRFQEACKRVTTLPPLIFYGRGIFNYTFGGLPHRRPIHTIVGEPIRVTRNPTPTREEVQEMHAKYVSSLSDLFDAHKTKYGYENDAKLIIY